MIITVTAITTITALGISAAMSVAAVITLIAFLTARELASASNSSWPLRLAKFTNIGILPLILAFVVTVIVKIIEVL